MPLQRIFNDLDAVSSAFPVTSGHVPAFPATRRAAVSRGIQDAAVEMDPFFYNAVEMDLVALLVFLSFLGLVCRL
jgi:hypothetical protein